MSGASNLGYATLYKTKAHVYQINLETRDSWLPLIDSAIPISFVASIPSHGQPNEPSKRELKIVGFNQKGEKVLDAMVLPKTVFQKRSQRFGQWTDSTGMVYGLGFDLETELTAFIETFQQLQRDILTSNNERTSSGDAKNRNATPEYNESNLSNQDYIAQDQLKYENERLKQALEESSKNAGVWHTELLNLRTNNVKLTQALQESKKHVEDWERELLSLRDENKDLKMRMSSDAPVTNGYKHQSMAKGSSVDNFGGSTKALHGGSKPNHWTHSPIMPPLYMSTTFEVLEPGHAIYDYSRSDNPTRTELQNIMASLEFAKHALAFSSGLGALTTMSYLLKSGQHILCCDDVYGGTFRFFSKCLSRMGIETSYVDGTSPRNWANNFRVGETKMVWIETPTNPTLKVVNIQAVVKEIKAIDPSCIVVVDNTFMTPVFQNPLKLGADIVSHSCSKYFGGHSDIIMGALMTSDDELYSKLKFFQNSLGITPGTFDCHMMIRSIKTLTIRVKAQEANAIRLANYLENHPCVEKVIYPGLESHPQHDLTKRQCSGFGAMLSIYVKEFNGQEAGKIMRAVKIFHPAESLGCVCSLIEVPALMTHASVPEVEREKLGITNNMLRISAGIEDFEDLQQDLEQALESSYKNI